MKLPVKILIVEDEFLIAMGLEFELKQKKYEVINIVASGEKAIEIVQHQTPNLILMDIRLAGEIDGVETAHQIQSFSAIPIIFMTGYSNPEIMDKTKLLNPLGYLVKPVIIPELKSIIDTHFLIEEHT